MITSLRWQDVLDIIVVAFIIYRTFLLVKGTRATQLIVGVIVIFFVFYLSKKLELFALGWILNNFVSSIILVIVVVFQKIFLSVSGNRPLLTISMMLIISGLQFICFGLLAELQIRSYHETTKKAIYAVRKIVEKEKKQEKTEN